MFWRVDSTMSDDSFDFPRKGFGNIFDCFKFWKSKNKLCPLCRITFGRMITSQDHDEFIAVRVQDPRVQNEGSWNSYVDFKIFLHTNSKAFTAKTSCVRRRYSEFVWLKKKLQKNTGLVPVPDLPQKSIFSFINDDFIERRRKGLQSFLDKVLHMTVCLSDSQLHLFLQTQLPVKHIEDCVQGHTPYTVTEAILNYASSNLGWVQEEGGRDQELWPSPVPYESVESPAPHLPSLQSPASTFIGRPHELTDVSDSESRLSDADQTAHDLKQVLVHEQLPQEGQRCELVEVHLNLVGSVEIEEEGGIIGSNKVTNDLQRNDCEYPTLQTVRHLVDKPLQGDSSNDEDLEQGTFVGEDFVDITPIDRVIEDMTLGDINEVKKGGQDVGLEQDSTVTQTTKKDLYEEDSRVRIRNNEVTLDLIAVKEESAENHREMVLESAAITVDVALHDASEENMPDTKDHEQAEITEDHMVQENGVSDEDYSEDAAVQEEAMNANEEHVGEVNKLNAKCHQPGSGILILGGIEETVSTQTSPMTETVSNLDANAVDDNTLVLKAIEIDSMQCQETDSHIIITTHQPDAN